MRLRNVKNANLIIVNSDYVIKDEKKYIGKYKDIFKNNNKINIEIGMGKGDFIIGMARKYPDINFIGIEKYESVIVRAVEKLEGVSLPNLKLIRMDALEIDEVFDREIDTIYLNFSDPWPKTRHEKRRLTSDIFLSKYDKIFIGDSKIIQKTDNIGLFAYSIENLSKNGYIFNKVSLNLDNEDIDNVETEYEKKFKSMKVKINYLNAIKKRGNKNER